MLNEKIGFLTSKPFYIPLNCVLTVVEPPDM